MTWEAAEFPELTARPSMWRMRMALSAPPWSVNWSSSEFTLTVMSVVSILVPFVLAYIVHAWHAIDKKKLTKDELQGDDHAY